MGKNQSDRAATSCILRTAVASLEQTVSEVKAQHMTPDELLQARLEPMRQWRLESIRRRIRPEASAELKSARKA